MSKKRFPGYRYGPDGQAKLFNSPDEVPAGWSRSVNGPFGDPEPDTKPTAAEAKAAKEVKAAERAAKKAADKLAKEDEAREAAEAGNPVPADDPEKDDDARTDDELRAALVAADFVVPDDATRAEMLEELAEIEGE